MTDYSKSKIYKIVCNKTGLIYYGSTTKKYKIQKININVKVKKTIRFML